jgi:hypothetical protein
VVSTPVPGDGNSRGPAARVDDRPHVSTVNETSEVAGVNREAKGARGWRAAFGFGLSNVAGSAEIIDSSLNWRGFFFFFFSPQIPQIGTRLGEDPQCI